MSDWKKEAKETAETIKDILKIPIIFLVSNWIYLIWFVIYFTIAWWVWGFGLDGFLFVFTIYAITITTALSPIGETILRILENCREPSTREERDYLLPIFEEVYKDAKEVNPRLEDDIKLYIKDAMHTESFAMGRRTIVITKGAITTLSENELMGIIACELGHIAYGHTKAVLLVSIGNFFFTAIVWLFRGLLFIIQFFADIWANSSKLGKVLMIIMVIVRFLYEASGFIFINVSEIILAINSRSNETQADRFACDIGYGIELLDALYSLQKISIHKEMKVMERAKANQRNIAFRIRDLERLDSGEEE